MRTALLILASMLTTLFVTGDLRAQSQTDYIRVTEIDYDQPGSDAAEWVELHNDFGVEFQTDQTFLVFYDADSSGTCQEYCRVDLSPLGFIDSNQYVVIGNHPCALLPLCNATEAIQNGSPDAVAIEQFGMVLWSLEYDFAVAASACMLTPVIPQWTSPLQTGAADSDLSNGSIQLCFGTWGFFEAATPCADNGCVTSSVPEFVEQVRWGLLKKIYRE